jgi:hypothetical protein
MYKVKCLGAFALSVLSVSVLAENEVSNNNIYCVEEKKECVAVLELDPGVVSWYITSQADGNPGLSMRYIAPNGMPVEVMKTSVFSKDLSNKSFGDFEVIVEGTYELVFSNITKLRGQDSGIFNRSTAVSINYQYAGEDGVDDDFNDVYSALTWFRRKN